METDLSTYSSQSEVALELRDTIMPYFTVTSKSPVNDLTPGKLPPIEISVYLFRTPNPPRPENGHSVDQQTICYGVR